MQTCETLKPCPFCGCNPIYAFTWVDAETTFHSIECHDCGAQLGCRMSQSEVIAAWNTRAISERERALVEAAKDWINWLDSDGDGWGDDAADYEARVLNNLRAALAAYGDEK